MPSIPVRLKVPALPNFVFTDVFGLGDDAKVDIAILDEKTLRELGAEWTDALVKHASSRRRDRERMEQTTRDEFLKKVGEGGCGR